MKTWFAIYRWRDGIEPIEVIRETDHFLVVPCSYGRVKERRISKGWEYHTSYAEARAEQVSRCEASLRTAKDGLTRAQERLDKANQLPLEYEPK